MNNDKEVVEIKKQIVILKSRLNLATVREKDIEKSYKKQLKEMRELEMKTERRKKAVLLKKHYLNTVIFTS